MKNESNIVEINYYNSAWKKGQHAQTGKRVGKNILKEINLA